MIAVAALMLFQAGTVKSAYDTAYNSAYNTAFKGAYKSAVISGVKSVVRSDVKSAVKRSVEYSDAYYTRLTIHRIASYTMLPLFAGEYVLGQQLLDNRPDAKWVKATHVGVALGIGALFTVNTVTGLWNLWDARNDPNDRTRRYLHAGLLLASDLAFAVAPHFADDDGEGRNLSTHRNIAIAGMSAATLGTLIMWLRK